MLSMIYDLQKSYALSFNITFLHKVILGTVTTEYSFYSFKVPFKKHLEVKYV